MNQEDNHNHNHDQDNHDRDEYPRPSLEDIALASVYLPLARANILDYLYISGISLPPIFGDVVAGVGGGGAAGGIGGGAHIDGIASILANSLYDCRPVKTVVDEKGMAEISEKIFTAQMAEESKINTVCGIWQDDFEEGERIKILPCNHAFKIDAIEKWLTTEKAECPICRFSLSSKEVICHPPSSDVAGGGAAVAGAGAEVILVDEQHIRNQDVSRINENNIAARLVDSIQNHSHREDPVRVVYANANASLHSHQSISVPMNQLLQSRRNMIDNLARASGGDARVASQWRPMASSAPPVVAAAAEPAANPQYINNNYYFGNIINHQIINNNEYDDADDADAEEHDNNRYNLDNYNNYNNYNNNHISNQERDDIQEAIRRSLE